MSSSQSAGSTGRSHSPSVARIARKSIVCGRSVPGQGIELFTDAVGHRAKRCITPVSTSGSLDRRPRRRKQATNQREPDHDRFDHRERGIPVDQLLGHHYSTMARFLPATFRSRSSWGWRIRPWFLAAGNYCVSVEPGACIRGTDYREFLLDGGANAQGRPNRLKKTTLAVTWPSKAALFCSEPRICRGYFYFSNCQASKAEAAARYPASTSCGCAS